MTGSPESPDETRSSAPAGERCYCPVGGVVDLLSKRHAIPVICAVGALEPVRYSEIEASFGEVSSSTLSTRLRELDDAGILEREQFDTIPPRVEYRLSAEGRELCDLLDPLLRWVEERDNSMKG